MKKVLHFAAGVLCGIAVVLLVLDPGRFLTPIIILLALTAILMFLARFLPEVADFFSQAGRYSRFTDRARKVMRFANQEAQSMNYEFIGTEHILLGLVKEGTGVAANVLKNHDVDLRKIRLELEKIVVAGPNTVYPGRLPLTPRAKKLIEYAKEEARNLKHNYLGTEHLLFGLLRDQVSVAAHVLMNLGVELESVREEIRNLLGHAKS
jgi:ATP-dependent Clp protease ATP-binding subunit ClpA